MNVELELAGLPIARPVGSRRFPASPLVGVPKWATGWQEAQPAPERSSGGGIGHTSTNTQFSTQFSFFSLPSVITVQALDQPVVRPSPRRLRRNEVRLIEQELSERDRAILHSFQTVPLLNGNQLERLHFTDLAEPSRDRRRRDVLGRLVRHRLLERLARRVGGVRSGSSGYVYGLGLVGERILEDRALQQRQHGSHAPPTRRSRWRGGIALVSHSLGLAEVYVRANEAATAGHIQNLYFEAEPICWHTVQPDDVLEQPWTLKPDGLIRFENNGKQEHWFVEIDRGTESPSTLRKKVDTYERAWEAGFNIDGFMPRVWWVAVR